MAGMTSLAAQLRKLQTPQTSLLDQSTGGTSRPSLLFEAREAATLDADTVYAIGCSGLEELCKLNPKAFSKFDQNLFSDWGKNLQRAVQTKEQNAQLDAMLTEFLYKLSPYLLLRPAHKALEWLLYRFRVHEYNISVLLQAILPFHETNIFARILQLIDVSDESTCWHFLAATKAQGAVLTKKALIAQCAKSPGLFRFVCDLVPAMHKVNMGSALRPAMNLSTGVIIGVMELHGHRIDSKLVSAIVAHVADGFVHAKQDGNPEWISANAMVVAQLVKKQPSLKPDLLQLLLITMMKSLTEESVNAGLFTLLAAYRYQTNLTTLPQKVTKALLAFDDMPDRLRTAVSGSKYANKFMTLFVHGLFVHALMEPPESDTNALVLPYFNFIMETPEQKAMVAEQFLKAHLLVRVTSGDKKCLVIASRILDKLKQRAGDELDNEIVKGFQSNDRELVAELATECSLGIQHKAVGDSGETLFLAMMNKMSHIRMSAVTTLVNEASTMETDDFVKRSLKTIISTETDPMVYGALVESLTAETLVKFVDADEAIGLITERLCSLRKKKWNQVNERLVHLVCDGLASSASPRSILRFLLTLSVVLRPSDMTLVKVILESHIAKSHPELKHLSKCVITEDAEPVEICDTIAAALAKGFTSASVENLLELLSSNEGTTNFRTSYGSLRFIEHLVSQSKPLGIGVLNSTLDTLQAMLPALAEVEVDEIEALSGGTLPLRCVTRVISALLRNMQPVKDLEKVPSWHKLIDVHSSEVTFLRRVFSIAVGRQKHERSFKEVLQLLFTVCLPSPASRCNFLCDMLLGHLTEAVQSDESLRLQAHSLCILGQFVSELDEAKSELIILSIIVVLLSPSKRIRRLALSVLGQCGNEPFVEYMVKHASSTTDLETVRKCVSNFHKTHKVTCLNRVLSSEDLTPVVRLGVARLLQNVASSTTIDVSLDLIKYYVDNPGLTIDSVNCEIIQLCLQKLSMISTKKLNEQQHNVLFGVLKSSNDALCMLGLQSLSSELFDKMSDSEITEIVDHLLSSIIEAQSETHREAAESALRTICECQPKQVVVELSKVTVDDLSNVQSVREVKRMRTSLKESNARDSKATVEDPLETVDWRRAVILLELLHGVRDLPKVAAEQVVTALYDVLKRSLELPASSLNVEYVKQCTLSCLQVHGTGSDELLRPHRHQISLLVKALRLSQSAQTQHAILAMLNHMASLYPDEVLQNMTSVFTFMGTSLLRQEDEYSFQVVVQTIQSVIPILLEASKNKSNKDVVSKVTRVFVDSWPDIPEHRRHPIFKKLIETLGPSDYVWTLVAQMIDHLLEKEADLEDCDFLEFMLGLVGDLSLDTILCSCQHLLKFSLSVPIYQKFANRSSIDREIVNVSQCSDQRLADFKSVSAMFVEQVLSGTNFLSLAAELDDNELTEAEEQYEALLAVSLESIHALNAAIQDRADDELLDSWKSNISLLHDCVDRVSGVLRPNTLIAVIQKLLSEDLPSIRRNAMDMLNNKLVADTFFDDCDEIVTLVDPLCAQVQKITDQDVINQQTALVSLKLICRRVPAGSEEMGKIFGIVEKLFRSYEKYTDVIIGGSLLLFAELCHSCPTKMLNHFAKLMKRFLAISSMPERSEAIILGLVVSYHRLVENLTGFLSPYLPKMIGDVCHLCADQDLKQHDNVVGEQLDKICAHIGENVPLRVLLPSIEDCLSDRPPVKETPLYLNHLLRIFKSAIESSDRHVFDQQREVVQSLVLRLLHFREEAASEQMDSEHLTNAEGFIVDCVTALSLKMSEMTFRPFISKLYIWATLPAEDQQVNEVHRIATFYHLCYKLSDTLKGLFVLFSGQFIQHAVDTLNKYRTQSENSDSTTKIETTSWILGTMSNCFQYGGKAFVTVEMYKTVSKAIVDEIENTAESPANTYERRVLTRLAPAVANLAVACLDADCKDLHNKVLFKTRNSSARIRFSALQTFAAMVRRLGDDYVPLLPESVPFLAELMEDDHAEVENLTQEVVQEMEQLLGEPLMKYF